MVVSVRILGAWGVVPGRVRSYRKEIPLSPCPLPCDAVAVALRSVPALVL